MALITFFAAFAISILTGLGVGSGGLMVIYLALFTDTPQLMAQGINLLFFIFSAGASLPFHLLRRKILTSPVMILAFFGIFGAILGSILSNAIDESLLRKIFGAMLAVSGILSLRNSFAAHDKSKKIS